MKKKDYIEQFGIAGEMRLKKNKRRNKFGKKKDDINEEIYNIAEYQLPGDIKDLHEKDVKEKTNPENKGKLLDKSEEEIKINDISSSTQSSSDIDNQIEREQKIIDEVWVEKVNEKEKNTKGTEDINRNKIFIKRIHKLMQSAGSGPQGRQEKINLLREIYGDDFIKDNITEKPSRKDPINGLLEKAEIEIDKELESMTKINISDERKESSSVDNQEADVKKDKNGVQGDGFRGNQNDNVNGKGENNDNDSGAAKNSFLDNETIEKKDKNDTKKSNFDWQKRKEEPEVIDVEFVEHKPLEITDQNWRGERSKQIDQMKRDLEQARKEYLEMDYKKRGMWQKVGRFFGDKIFGRKGREEVSMKAGEKTGDMIVDDQDVVYMRALYENKLVDLRNAMLEDAKEKGMKAEDLEEMGKFFEVESRVNLADEHDNVRVENSGRFAGPLRENLVKMNEWYRKQPLKYKLAVGAAFGLGGAAASFGLIAGSAATAFTIAAVSRRAAMGAITGTGAGIFAEGVAKKGREKRAKKGSEEFAKKAENLSEEEIKNKLDELIFSADEKLQSYKNWEKIRLAAGGAVAGIIGSGAMGEIFRFLSGKAGTAELAPKVWHKVAGIFKKVGTSVMDNNETIENAGTLAPDNNATAEKSGAKISGKTAPGSKAGVLKNINLEIKKGGSFEGAIIKQLENSGTSKKEAGKMAHGMYREYIKNHPDPTGKGYNLVHPGAKLELSPDGKHVVDFKDSPPSEWDKHPGAKGADHHKSGRTPSAPKIETVSAGTATEAFDFDKTYQDLSGMKAMEREMLDIRAREKGFEEFSYGKSKVDLAYLDDQIVQNQNRMKFYGNPELLDGKERDIAKGFKETLEDLMKRKMALEFKIRDWERFKELNELFSGSTSKVFNKIAKLALFEAGAHEEFSLDKMAAAEYIGNHPKGNFGKFYKDCMKIYGKKEIQPIAGENMKEWAGRVTKLIVKRRMMSEN